MRGPAQLNPATAAPVPVALRSDVDMDRFRVAIGTYAAAPWHIAHIAGKLPFADTRNLHIGRGASHMERMFRTMHGAVMRGIAIAGGHQHLAAIVAFDSLQKAH